MYENICKEVSFLWSYIKSLTFNLSQKMDSSGEF